jgi:DNA-binding MarR family transcriptional regulator
LHAYTINMTLDAKSLDTKSVEGVCIGGCVRMLNRMVSAIYDGALANARVKTSQFSVLVSVANRKQARPAELIKHLQLDESTLSRNVGRMCARGWLRLVQDVDRRSHLIEVTDKGLALICKCLPSWQRAQAEVGRRLGTDTITELRSALRKLSARN